MAPPTELPAISEETVEMIDSQVKKGKVRKFFLIYKGASIKSLVVFKKGPFGPKVMQAKKNGFKGDVAYGTVTGSGKNLSFMLPANGEVAAAMKVDSFEEGPPTKTAKLREFLMANGLKFKPEFQMVTEVAGLIDPESDDDAIPTAPPPPGTIPEAPPPPGSVPPPPPPPESQQEGGSIPPPPPPPDSFKVQFATRFKRLKPDLDKVVAARVSVSQDTKLKASEVGVFARKAEFESAVELLDDLKDLIEQGLAEINHATGDGTDPAAAFKSRLSNLVTRIKASAGTDAANDAKLKASEAGVFARKQDFDQARQLLTEAESILETAAGAPPPPPPPGSESVPPPPPPPPGSDPAAEFRKRLTALLPKIKKTVGTPPGDDAKLKASEANVFARKKEFDNANALLDQIDELLAAPVAGGLDAALQQWATARTNARDTLKALERSIAAMKDPDGDAAIILVKAIQANLTESPSTARQVDELERYISTDDIVMEAEAPNGFGIKVELRTPLLAALAGIRTVLAAGQGA